MKNKKILILLIVFLSITGIALVFGMILIINKDINFSFGFSLGSHNLKIVDSFDAEAKSISMLDLKVSSTDIELKESTNNNLKIEYLSNKEDTNVIKKDGNKVYIEEDDFKTICIGICSNQRKVIVYIPTSYNGNINISSRSGDIASSLEIIENEVNVSTTSGNIAFNNATNISMTTTSGDISLNNTNMAKLSTTSGDIKITGEVNSLDVTTTSGDVEVKKINKNANINTTSGDIDITQLAITDISNFETVSGDIVIYNNSSDCYIDYKTHSGDSKINKSDRKSDIVLNVHTTSGDIRVD